MPRPLLLLLGDSITEYGSRLDTDGWIALLLNRYNRSADIAQRGMGGYTTQWFMDVVIQTIRNDLGTTLHPQLITLWLGANDAALIDGPSKHQHVPVPKYKSNLHAMLAVFKERAPQAKVLLITPPAVDDDRRHGSGGQDRTNAATGEYARACVEVASEAGVEVLDLYAVFNALPAPQWKALLIDGLHLNKEGNHFMEQHLVDFIKAKFPDLQKQLDTWEFPPFSDMMDAEEPVAAPSALDAPISWLKSWLA